MTDLETVASCRNARRSAAIERIESDPGLKGKQGKATEVESANEKMERETGLEPATSSLGSYTRL